MSSVSIRVMFFFFFSSRRRHTRCSRDWSSDVCSSDLSPSGNAGDLWAVNQNGIDGSLLNNPGRVMGQQTPGSLPRLGTHLDSPSYPEPAPPSASFNGSTVVNGTAYLCPGQYTNQITVQSAGTAVLFPGVYKVVAGGGSLQGARRTPTRADVPISRCG